MWGTDTKAVSCMHESCIFARNTNETAEMVTLTPELTFLRLIEFRVKVLKTSIITRVCHYSDWIRLKPFEIVFTVCFESSNCISLDLQKDQLFFSPPRAPANSWWATRAWQDLGANNQLRGCQTAIQSAESCQRSCCCCAANNANENKANPFSPSARLNVSPADDPLSSVWISCFQLQSYLSIRTKLYLALLSLKF